MDRSGQTVTHHLAAVVFADIVGYTALTSVDEQAALASVEAFQNAARAVAAAFGGRIVKFVGDGTLVEFGSSESAVRAADALLRTYAEGRPRREDSLGDDLRIAVHVGDVAMAPDGDVYGDGVNVCSRLQNEAQPDQVVVSEDVWRQLRQRPAIAFEALGERQLKGAGSIGVYAARVEGSPVDTTSVMYPKPGPTRAERDDFQSIAVLPFTDMSPAGDQEYLCDGIAEELLNTIARLPDVRVPARTSCFAFKSQSLDVREIGRKLDVDAVFEGSIRKAGDRLRITARLIDVDDGSNLWSETYDREMEDVFAIQDDIATRVVATLHPEAAMTAAGAAEPAPSAGTESIQAYEFYLRGRQFMHRFSLRDVHFAREMFERAIEVDPDYARAYAGLADVYAWLFDYWEGNAENIEKSELWSRRALDLAPDLAEAHCALGQALALGRRYEAATKAFERARELDPGLYEACYFHARSRWMAGDLEGAVEHFERGHEVQPEEFQCLILQAVAYEGLGQHDRAMEVSRRAMMAIERRLDLNPDDMRAYYLGAGCLQSLGDTERAEAWAQRALEGAGNDSMVWYNVACYYARAGDADRALEYLAKAVSLGAQHREWMANDADWRKLRDDPRFIEILDRIEH